MAQQRSTESEVRNSYGEGRSGIRLAGPSTSTEPVTLNLPQTNELPEISETAMPAVGIAAEGHLFLVLPPGEVVTGTMALAAAEEVSGLAGARKMPVLLVLTGVEAITRAARDVFSNAGSLAAVAVLGVSPVDRVIANFLLGGSTQPCPTRYFSDEQDALDWLKRKKHVA